jgi:hypothetical protein
MSTKNMIVCSSYHMTDPAMGSIKKYVFVCHVAFKTFGPYSYAWTIIKNLSVC